MTGPWQTKFCSRSCAAKINNRLYPKRTKQNICLGLGCLTPTVSKSGLCRKCYLENNRKIAGSLTKRELFSSLSWQTARSRIQCHARRSISIEKCQICNYDNHVEVCHVRPVRDFPMEATVKEINDTKNLIALCPNHHWEFDHGLLDHTP